MMSNLLFASCTRFAMAIVLGLSQPAPSHARVGNLMREKVASLHKNRRAQATNNGNPKYQKLPYYWPLCPVGFDITTQEECIKAAASLDLTTEQSLWSGSFEGGPKFCSHSKKIDPNFNFGTNSMVFNENAAAATRRKDLAPVCKWTGDESPPEFIRVSREDVTEWRGEENTITVKSEEWDYFLAFQESRKNGFSCPCNSEVSCNEIKEKGKHWHSPNQEKATFDCAMWIAAWMHAEDQSIQDYCSHDGKDGWSPGMRCKFHGTVCTGEHTACQGARHTGGRDALRGLQSSAGHCNSMFNPSFKGFAVAHGADQTSGRDNVWTALYNNGGIDIKGSESCIPPGYTATGEQAPSQPMAPPQSTPSPTTPQSEPTAPTPGPPSDYQKLDYGEDACPEGLEIKSEGECSEAIAALGITEGGKPWTGSRNNMPKGCSLQKDTNNMVFNTGEGGMGRQDLAPVCKLTGDPDPTTPSPVASPPVATPTASPVGDNDPCKYTGPTVQVKIEIEACQNPKKIRWKIKPAEVAGCKTIKKGKVSKKVKPCDLYKKEVQLHVGKKYKIIVIDKNKIRKDTIYKVLSGGNDLANDDAFGKKSKNNFRVPS